jgi:hypothetical protein
VFREPLDWATRFLWTYLPCIAGWGFIGWVVYPLFNRIPPGVKIDVDLETKLQSGCAFVTAVLAGVFTGKIVHLVLMAGDELKMLHQNAEEITKLESELGLDAREGIEIPPVPENSQALAWASAVLLGSILGGALAILFVLSSARRLDVFSGYLALWLGAFAGTLIGAALGMGPAELRIRRISRSQKRRLRELQAKASKPTTDVFPAKQQRSTLTYALAWCAVAYCLFVGLQLLFIALRPFQQPVDWLEVFLGPLVGIASSAALVGGVVWLERICAYSKKQKTSRRAQSEKNRDDYP